MAKVNAQQLADKWGRRLKGASQDIREGINRVTVAPGVAAAKKADKMLAGIQASIADGTWQRAVAGVTLDDWKSKAINKGIGRIAAGVDAAMPKMEMRAEQLLNAIDRVNAKVQAMPDNTLDDRINRMVEFTRGMASAKIK